ncbi:hypothetical protein [Lysobacter gummosus]|uniref:hypothetical protein n=1 Tax=Lysobacter gummosus TaxID=262324 RepID=UPI00363DACA9
MPCDCCEPGATCAASCRVVCLAGSAGQRVASASWSSLTTLSTYCVILCAVVHKSCFRGSDNVCRACPALLRRNVPTRGHLPRNRQFNVRRTNVRTGVRPEGRMARPVAGEAIGTAWLRGCLSDLR